MLARRAAGATIAELAMRFDIHRTTAIAHLKRNSPLPNPSR
jgi:DNA-binding CsgD family transcriptional regulator